MVNILGKRAIPLSPVSTSLCMYGLDCIIGCHFIIQFREILSSVLIVEGSSQCLPQKVKFPLKGIHSLGRETLP